MIPIRSRIGTSSAIFVACWSLPWSIGLFFILFRGEIPWDGEGGETEIITRSADPIWYWSIVAVITIMNVAVLALTFEYRPTSDSSQD